MNAAALKKYYYTIRHLEPVQVYFRAYYMVKRHMFERTGEAVTLRYRRRYLHNRPFAVHADQAFLAAGRRYYAGDLEEVLRNEITFLHRTIRFGAVIDWHRPELNRGTRLWKLNLNYHEFLIDIAAACRQSGDRRYLDYLVGTIREWFRQNPIGTRDYGKDNWNSYAISLRVVSWIKIWTLLQDDLPEDFREDFLQSLWIQCHFLNDNLELDILGNHLIKNWKALHFAAHFFRIPAFRMRADRLYERYVAPQFTAAGMHEELSPMYAGIVLEDLMEVYPLSRDAALADLIHRQWRCVELLSFGDEYLFFNDSVNGNGVSVRQLAARYRQLFPERPGLTLPAVINVDGYLGDRKSVV